MAKIFGPLHSDSASGTIGKSLTFANRLGKAVVRGYAIPSNPQSADQAEVRTKLAIPGKVAKVAEKGSTSDCTFIIQMKAAAAAGQTWNSQLSKEVLGTNLASYDADASEYSGLGAPAQLLWTTAAEGLGMVEFELNYGAFGAVTTGEQLYHGAKAAYRTGIAIAATDPSGWDEAAINTFAGKLADAV